MINAYKKVCKHFGFESDYKVSVIQIGNNYGLKIKRNGYTFLVKSNKDGYTILYDNCKDTVDNVNEIASWVVELYKERKLWRTESVL